MIDELITRATAINEPSKIRQIENYMRDIVFHSTLDWQTAAQLEEAAQKAATVLFPTLPYAERLSTAINLLERAAQQASLAGEIDASFQIMAIRSELSKKRKFGKPGERKK